MKSSLLIATTLFALISTTQAQPIPPTTPIQGIHFSHNDWEIACDNTGTCRAAGYTTFFTKEDTLNISILLTRQAGADQPVTGEFSYVIFDDEKTINQFQLWIDNRNYGNINTTQLPAPLSEKQVLALLGTAKTNATITFVAGERRGILSNQGMSAVLLKMDDFQQRINTPSALIRRGNQPQTSVLQPQPVPVMSIPVTLENDENLKQHYLDQQDKLLALTEDDYNNNCTFEDEAEDGTIQRKPMYFWDSVVNEIYPLNSNQALYERSCWSAAYNYGHTYWLIDKELTAAKLIKTEAVGYENGEIDVYQKGRGYGDCIYKETYSWNGEQFIQTSVASTGMCRGQPGGFWWLQTYVYEVKREHQ